MHHGFYLKGIDVMQHLWSVHAHTEGEIKNELEWVDGGDRGTGQGLSRLYQRPWDLRKDDRLGGT